VVSRAEFVFFAGGDQAHYAAWAQSPLLAAVQQVYARGGVVGGTSAGLAILGEFTFDAIAAGPTSVTSSLALANPQSPLISFSHQLFTFEPLRGVVTDSHFRARDRLGRLVVFAARQHADNLVTRTPREVLGLGIDEGTALVVDASGSARLRLQRSGQGGAWAVRVPPATSLIAGQPLQHDAVQVTRLTDPALHRFELSTWCGTGPRFRLSYDGGQPSPLDGYAAPDEALPCP
jgi:cyanophycinase